MNLKILPIALGIAIIVLLGVLIFVPGKKENDEPKPDLGTFYSYTSPKGQAVRVNVIPYQLITSPLALKGEARGFWYFEASFPATLLDDNGNVLKQLPIQAEGEWMTEDFVPFSASIEWPAAETETGTLVLEKDNPSALPENADEIRIPVRFR